MEYEMEFDNIYNNLYCKVSIFFGLELNLSRLVIVIQMRYVVYGFYVYMFFVIVII